MKDSTENATPPKSTKSRISNFSVQVQIKPKSRLFASEFVLQDTKKSECLDSMDCRNETFSVKTVIAMFLPKLKTDTARYRVANIHTMTYLYMSFSAKEPCNQWLFGGKRSAT